MESSSLALSALYLFHMTASVVWCGGMLLIFLDNRFFLKQTAGGSLNLKTRQRRLVFLAGWFCLGVIGATGLFQMSANTNYSGFLAINNPWSQAILIKHLLVVLFLGVFFFLNGVLEGRFTKAAIRLKRDETHRLEMDKIARAENRTIVLLYVLFFAILLFTSMAMAA